MVEGRSGVLGLAHSRFAILQPFSDCFQEFLVRKEFLVHLCALVCEIDANLQLCLDTVHFQSISLISPGCGQHLKYTLCMCIATWDGEDVGTDLPQILKWDICSGK